MGRIEFTWCLGLVVDIIGHTGTTYDQGIDTQVEWGMSSGILRSQGVENELEIVRCISLLAIECQTCSEELG